MNETVKDGLQGAGKSILYVWLPLLSLVWITSAPGFPENTSWIHSYWVSSMVLLLVEAGGVLIFLFCAAYAITKGIKKGAK